MLKDLKDTWDCIYGSKSHMNTAGKIIIGIPMAPLVLLFAVVWASLDALFSKQEQG